MALVQYSDSESENESSSANEKLAPVVATCTSTPTPTPSSTSTSTSTRKRKRTPTPPSTSLPPLPSAFHDLYSAAARIGTTDDPSLHGGRKRAVPHIDGNWPSHVYLEWIPSPSESNNLHRLITHVKDSLHRHNAKRSPQLAIPDLKPSLQSDLGVPLPLHVSLSRTLQIKTNHRALFLDTLRSHIRTAAVHPFHFTFDRLKWVPNFQRNRWFLVLGITKPPHNQLNRLLAASNQAAETHGHPGLYMGGSGDGPMQHHVSSHDVENQRLDGNKAADYSEYFHVSIAWNLTEPDAEWIDLVQSINVSDYVQAPEVAFDVVKVRVGNVVHNINLEPSRSSLGRGRGLLGLT